LIIVRILIFGLGVAIVIGTLLSAVRTFVLPRSAPEAITRIVFLVMRRLFDLWLWRTDAYLDRDRVMALYAPFSLLVLPAVWLTLAAIGYTGMFWGLGVASLHQAFSLSGSSLLTLGFATANDMPKTIMIFSEATIGLVLVALLISYLPTMYAAFSRREATVTLLEVRAGSPASATEMILRFHRLNRMSYFNDLWIAWESWFVELEESHTSLPALAFFRSPQPERSWITAAGAVLDASALAVAVIDMPHDPQADLCIRAGYLALSRIADFFGITYAAHPKPTDPISIAQSEFDAVCERLIAAGVKLKPDREQAWRDFSGWRVNYDTVLLRLAILVEAPVTPWVSDRAPPNYHPRIRFRIRKRRE
jgi:hypothetical protein